MTRSSLMIYLFFDDGFLTFDGLVIEAFSDRGRSDRYHLHYVNKIEVETLNKRYAGVRLA
jgi:hypothetical protein